MKNHVMLLLSIFFGLVTVSQSKIINDPNARLRQVGSFHAIEVSNAIDLYLSQDEHEAVAVSAVDEEIRNNIKTSVVNGVLKIWYGGKSRWWKWKGKQNMKAYVSVQRLDGLRASGASDVFISGSLKADDLKIVFSGASDLKEGAIDAKSVDLDLSGASDVKIRGRVVNIKIEASGASHFNGTDLQVDNCTASASGASKIRIMVNNELNAFASGASSIRYGGGGRIRDLKSSGASHISRVD